jgi:hypothetical protein
MELGSVSFYQTFTPLDQVEDHAWLRDPASLDQGLIKEK